MKNVIDYILNLFKISSADKKTLQSLSCHPKHHPPEYENCSGEWTLVLVCKCGSISKQVDNPPFYPCRDCGTLTKRKEHSGRWVGNRWEIHNEQ